MQALARRQAPAGVHRVRHARGRQRPLRAGGRARKVLDPKVFKVNLIPYNPSGSPYDGSQPEAIEAFRAALEEHGVRVTVRLTRGRDIAAACGQLAAARGLSETSVHGGRSE